MTWYVSVRRSQEKAELAGDIVLAEECVSRPTLLESGAIGYVRVYRNDKGEPFQHVDTVLAAGEWIDFYEPRDLRP